MQFLPAQRHHVVCAQLIPAAGRDHLRRPQQSKLDQLTGDHVLVIVKFGGGIGEDGVGKLTLHLAHLALPHAAAILPRQQQPQAKDVAVAEERQHGRLGTEDLLILANVIVNHLRDLFHPLPLAAVIRLRKTHVLEPVLRPRDAALLPDQVGATDQVRNDHQPQPRKHNRLFRADRLEALGQPIDVQTPADQHEREDHDEIARHAPERRHRQNREQHEQPPEHIPPHQPYRRDDQDQ